MIKYLAAVATCTALLVSHVNAGVMSFQFTGSQQTFVVPTDVYTISISAWGAQGMRNQGNVAGGLGGFATGDLAVSPGQVLAIYVGQGGSMTPMGGFNGGGVAGNGAQPAVAGGGGGASDVRIGNFGLSDRVIVAGGGGGAGGNRVARVGRGTGGGGGGGWYGGGGGAAWPHVSTTLPTGGNQLSGGSAGLSTWTSVSNNDGQAGGFGFGGNGGHEVSSSQAGSAQAAGGGHGGGLSGQSGLYGPNWTGQSGAGGSSYLGGVTGGVTVAGQRVGNGLVTLEWETVTAVVPEPRAVVVWLVVALGVLLASRRRVARLT